MASFCVLLFTAVALPVRAQLSGSWSGTYSLVGTAGGVLRLDLAGPFGPVVVGRVEAGGFASRAAFGSLDAGSLVMTLSLTDGTPVEFRGSFSGSGMLGIMRTREGRTGTALLTRVAPTAATDVTGTWSGSGSVSFPCHPGANPSTTVTVTGTIGVQLALTQTNGAVAGTIEVDNVPNDNDQCQVQGTLPPLIGPLTGSVSTSTFSGTASLPGDNGTLQFPFNATVSGSSMSLSANAGTDGSVTATLTQTSTQAPNSALSGTWSGSVTETFKPCETQPAITFTSPLTGQLFQAGNNLTGTLTATNEKKDSRDANGNCVVTDVGPGSVNIVAQIAGSTMTGIATDPQSSSKKSRVFAATISGNTISGSIPGDFAGEGSTFTMSHSSTVAPPVVVTFAAANGTLTPGASTTLSWATANASSVSIDNGIGSQPASGSITVSPKQTTTYALTATGPGGSVTATTTINVSTPPAQIVVSSLPAGMLQAVNGTPTTDRLSLTNTGGSDATVNLSVGNAIFSVAPTTATIAAGSTQVFVVHASPQAAPGTYTGNVAINGSAIQSGIVLPLTLLVAAPPTGSVLPQAAAPRVDVSGPQGQNPSGSVKFTNSGTSALQGIAVSDVPWIVPQSGVITIAPGATQAVTFTIDRSKRPDGATVGGAAGKISLLYLGSGSSKGVTTLGTTPANSISVTIVDVITPGTAPGTPPPLQPGELALWVDALTTTGGAAQAGDLYLSSFGSQPSINDLKIYYGGSTNPSALTATIPQFASNSAVAFPAAIRTIFGQNGPSAPLQLRSSNAANLAPVGVHLATTADRKASFIGTLPVLRSDRGIGPGESAVLTGVETSPTTSDAIHALAYVQEISGKDATVLFDARDANGNSLGTQALSVAAFSQGAIDVPDGTSAVVVKNTSTTAARLAAYATILDPATNDEFAVVDPSRAAGATSDTLVVPLVSSAAAATSTVYVTNGSGSTVNAGIEIVSEGKRHHAARFSARTAAVQPTTLNPLQTSRIVLSSTPGFARITGPVGSLSAAGRVSFAGYGGVYGSSLPAVPVSAALGKGQTKRFTAVDDASDVAVAAGTPATYRSSVVLIETAGQPATARLTLRYAFPAGSLVAAQAQSSKDFTVGAGQMLDVTDLARSVIGAQRGAMGDLHNVLLDVSVVDGAGKIVPFVVSVDNGSGDLVVRAE